MADNPQSCTDLVVRPTVTVREGALALVARNMPLGEKVVKLEGKKLVVISFPFVEHGVGGVLLPSAEVLAHHVASHETETLKAASEAASALGEKFYVVELGCGSAALGGLASAACAGVHAVVTDFVDILKLTRRTLSRNYGAVAASGGKVTSLPLPWGEALPASLAARRPGLVLGADIVYRTECHSALLTTLRLLCEVPAPAKGKNIYPTKVILAFAVRRPDEELSFFEAAKQAGFCAQELDVSCLPVGDHQCKVRLVQLVLGI